MKFILRERKILTLPGLRTTGVDRDVSPSYCILLFLPTKEIALLLISRKLLLFRRYWRERHCFLFESRMFQNEGVRMR